jgi:hypothetical protein
VLARKAGRVRWHAEVGNWLYQVAYRTALRARADRKRVRERQMVDPPEAAGREEAPWDARTSVFPAATSIGRRRSRRAER